MVFLVISAKISIQTGKYIHKNTWKKPTPKRKRQRITKSENWVKPIRQNILKRIQQRMIDFTLKWWNIGGEVKEPNNNPQYTTDPSTPNEALSKFKSFFRVTVQAGIQPWSTFTRIFVIQITTNQNIWIELANWTSFFWITIDSSSWISSILSHKSNIFSVSNIFLSFIGGFWELSSSSLLLGYFIWSG